ncbi:MAG: HD domain-containing protein [Nanobdellota archaeon]
MDIVSEIRSFVESECKKPTSKYGYEPFTFHFIPMVKRAVELADELGGDKESIELAAWLHDIGSIIHGREDHHITGAEIAEQKLQEYDYPAEKIDLIKKCIRNHRGSKDFDRESLEEQIIAEADAMSNFDNIGGIFKAAFCFEHLSQGEAKKAVREKLHRKWKQLHFDKSRELVRDKYEAAMLLLE